MKRPTSKEHAENLRVAMAESTLTAPQAEAFLRAVYPIAIALHQHYEDACSRPRSDAERREEQRLELKVRTLFAEAGLGLCLNGDCRGNPVGILTPKTGRMNTLGGDWRL